jgi:redox-sensitive bicupin YhaK (pirin superfamily)
MTIYADDPKTAAEVEKPCKGIERLLEARNTELGGFTVRRLMPSPHQHMIGPWIFFDHFGPTHMPPSKGIDIRPHPHINMATVTYLFEGEMLHQDSLASVQIIKPGAVNVMFAGHGIVHSERTPAHLRERGHTIEGLQLWLAVPEDIEENDPSFAHYGNEEVPTFQMGNIKGRVLIGEAFGVKSPVQAFSSTLYFEAFLEKGSQLTTPDSAKEIGIYVVSGQLSDGDIIISEGTMAVSTEHRGITVKAEEDTQLVVIGGEPIGHRYIWWNFVSSDAERIRQAAYDWDDQKFPEIPTDHDERIPIPDTKPA